MNRQEQIQLVDDTLSHFFPEESERKISREDIRKWISERITVPKPQLVPECCGLPESECTCKPNLCPHCGSDMDVHREMFHENHDCHRTGVRKC